MIAKRREKKEMTKQKIVFALVLAVAFLALTSGAEAAYWIRGTVDNASDGTLADGHTAMVYLPGDKTKNATGLIGPEGASHVNNKYMCDAGAIPGYTPAVDDTLNVEVIDIDDGYTAGPVSVTISGLGLDDAPDMTLRAPAAAPIIVINEFVSDNTTEWVELYNKGSDPVNLTGWTLEDKAGNIKPLSSLGTINVDDYKAFTYTWLNKDGDVIWLNDSTGTNIDRVGYGDSGDAPKPDAGKSTGRCPNGVDTDDDAVDFTKMDTPTPGAENECPVDTTAPTTEVTAPEMTGEPSPIPSGTTLNWTNTDVVLSFRSTDVSGINHTNYSKTGETGPWTTVNATTAIGPDEGNVTGISSTATGLTFNVTVSDEGITKIYYYSVDKNESANQETTKNLTVKIDTADPVINSVGLNTTTPGASGTILVTVNATDALSGVGKVTAAASDTATPVELTQNGNGWNGTITAEFLPGTYNVTVNATDNAGTTVTNDTWQYTIAEEYGVSLTDPADQSTYENINATYVITVENTGNVQDTFNLSVTNTDNAAVAELNTAQVTLDVGESTIVKLNVTDETVGTYNVSVYAESVNDSSANDTVTIMTTVREAPYVADITVTPSEATLILDVNGTQQFNATAWDQYNDEMEGIAFNWSSSDETVGTIDANGLFTAKAAGTTTIKAENGTVNGTATVTVLAVTTIEVTPTSATKKIGEKEQFKATAHYSDNSTEDVTTNATWESTDPTVGTIDANTGLFTARAAGTTTVKATYGGKVGTASVKVESGYRPSGGGGPPRDTDKDGYTDIQEMLAGTDKDDPCDPNPECAACLALKPAATPTPTAAPTATVTPTPTIPPVVTTPTPTPTPTPTEEPGFEAVFAIAGLLAVAYLVLRRKRK